MNRSEELYLNSAYSVFSSCLPNFFIKNGLSVITNWEFALFEFEARKPKHTDDYLSYSFISPRPFNHQFSSEVKLDIPSLNILFCDLAKDEVLTMCLLRRSFVSNLKLFTEPLDPFNSNLNTLNIKESSSYNLHQLIG